ncbi:DNA-processing protein DprA [Hamadaea sp. NPDC051192]|uniref:DNA-processing protein DprA n=1 Tax=Hamadaea sp. NPDC051192 TaxID=3154940 RepID=UPI00341FF24C
MTAGLLEQATLVALLRTRPDKMTWPEITAEVVADGTSTQLWERTRPASLLPTPGEADPIEQAAADIAAWQQSELNFVTVLDADYPARLRGVHEAPPVLFARGELRPAEFGVSVVGSRKASEQGLRVAAAIAEELVRLDMTVVSGLAQGIDTAAHRAALARDGRTVAVIGTGIREYYPATNRRLQDEIAERGLLLSQFWPDAPPQKHTFLMRNATMSGYGIATIVVEAGETSGARAQARMAVGHGRPVILTDAVVMATQWARDLVERPGIHVACGLEDVVRIVGELRASLDAEAEDVRRILFA